VKLKIAGFTSFGVSIEGLNTFKSHNLVQNAEYCESHSIIIEPLVKYFMPKFSSVEVTVFLPSLSLANNYCNGSLTFAVPY